MVISVVVDMEYLSVLWLIWNVYQRFGGYGVFISVVGVMECLSALWWIWNIYQCCG